MSQHTPSVTRRRALTLLGATAVSGLAGCSIPGGGGGEDEDDGGGEDGDDTEGSGEEDGGDNGEEGEQEDDARKPPFERGPRR